MPDQINPSEIVVAAMGCLLELAVNLASSNLAQQPDDSNIPTNVGWALETNRVAAHHLAALASELATVDDATAAELASAIASAGLTDIQRLSDEDLDEIYDPRPGSEMDCTQVCYSDGYSGHYLCEVTIDEVTFPCLGCPLVQRQFADFHQPPEWESRANGDTRSLPVATPPRNPGPPARRMMLDLTDAVNALSELKLGDLPADSSPRRRLTYIATVLAQAAVYGINIYFFALVEMAQLERDQAWHEAQPQDDRAVSLTRTLYKLITGNPFVEPDAQARRTRCERVFQASDHTERFYCNYLDTIPAHLKEEETIAEMCQRCPFHQHPRQPSLLELTGAAPQGS